MAVSRSWSGYVPPNRDNSKYNELTMEGSSCSVGLPKHGISGYFNLPNSSLRYFYYFAAAESKPMSKAPLILWMSGGPGCSSLLAAMMENGPCKVERDEMGKARAHLAKFGWNNKANVVWVDQVRSGEERSGELRRRVLRDDRKSYADASVCVATSPAANAAVARFLITAGRRRLLLRT